MTGRVRVVLAALALLLPLAVLVPAQADTNEAAAPAVVDLQRRLTLGNLHTCVVLDTGGVQCWGGNDNGQLGNGTTVTTTTPVVVSALSAVRQLSAGGSFTCALVYGGSLRCWGLNGNGQLGNGTTADSLVPVAVSGLSVATAVASGGFHACAITSTGTVACWGHDGMGQLGDGPLPDATPDPTDNPPGTASSVPVPVAGITAADPAVALALGEFHSCAVLASGAVRCWGHNGVGQLGDGTTTDRAASVAVAGLPDPTSNPAVAVTAGSSHTCVLLDDDTVRCWGANDYGQLGHRTAERPAGEQPDDVLVKLMVPSPTPLTVQIDSDPDPNVDDLDPLDGVSALSAGQYHACALVAGAVRCWGQNQRGQLGYDWKPLTDEWEDSVFAWPVPGLAGQDAVGAGGFHSCALDGTALACWGYDFSGQLGGYRASSPRPVAVTALTGAGPPGAVQVSAGTGFACALLDGVTPDQPACWGDNADGRLGSGSSAVNSQIRQLVNGMGATTQVDAGNGHACALTAGSGTPQCWGAGGSGQLGDGGSASSNVPVAVLGLGDAAQVSAGGGSGTNVGHTCAARTGGGAVCWGENGSGQLGDSTADDRSAPVAVQKDTDPDQADVSLAPLDGIAEVATGGFHSCALDTGGHVWCWGANGNGQLGDDTTTSRPFAFRVQTDTDPDIDTPLTGAVALALGDSFSCARLSTGQVRCWGANSSGQVGDGSTTQRRLPTLVTGFPLASTATAITAGSGHACATFSDGSLGCWGENGSGQLGDGSTTDSSSPVLAFGPAPSEANPFVLSVSGSRTNTCAALLDTTVACWGDNTHGQLGDGIGPSSLTPVAVATPLALAGNGIPEPVDDTATTTPGAAVVVAVLTNDADPDSDPLSVVAVGTPAHGTALDNLDGTVTYTPNPGFCGDDTFTYTVSDGTAAVPASVRIEMNCAPVAVNDAVTVAEDTATSLAVLGNDSDPDADPLTVVTVTQPSRGTAAVGAGGSAVTYTPAADACGPPVDAFTYTVSDGQGHTATATVTVTLTCAADAPLAGDDAASTPEDTPVVIAVLTNDSDPDGTSLSLTSVTPPGHGTAAVQGSAVRYVPAADYCGPDSFDYTVTDGALTDTATVSVSVTCAAESPRPQPDQASTPEDTAVVVAVLANDSDPDGGTLTVGAVEDPAHGNATVSGGGSTVTYTPDPNRCGSDSFDYTVSNGAFTATASVEVSVGCVADAPVAVPDAATTSEDVSVHVHVLTNDVDADSDPLTIVSATDPPQGTATVQVGSVLYTPDPQWCGGDTFEVTVRDPGGLQSSASVTVDVTCVNDAPVIAAVPAQGLPWGQPLTLLLGASDPDPGDPLTFSRVSGPAGLSVSPSGALTWTPTAAQVGPAGVTVRVSDAAGAASSTTVTVSVLRRPTTLSYSGGLAGTFSDLLTVRATLLDGLSGAPVAGRLVSFTIGTASASATTATSGDAQAGMLPGLPGSTAVGSAFLGDAVYLPSSDSDAITVVPEMASVTVTGPNLVLTSGSSASVTLTALLTEEADASLGSALAGSVVTFRQVAAGGGAVLCTATAVASGPGQATASCSAGALPVGSRAVVASLGSPRYTAAVDVAVATVAVVGKGAAAGAGVAGGEDFGFQLTPQRKGAPVGDAVHVVPGAGSVTVVRSSSPTSMAVTCGGTPKVCSATAGLGAASALSVDLSTGAVTGVAGMSTLAVSATDRAEPSGGSVPPDSYAVAVTGAVSHSLGTPSGQVPLLRGNIRVLG